MSTNFALADFISQWRVIQASHLKMAVFKCDAWIIFPLVKLLYENGIIRSFTCLGNNTIIIYFKYYQGGFNYYKLKIISTRGHRVNWSLEQLSKHYNKYNFSGFYIISTKYGLKTSTDCLFNSRLGGEVVIKVEV